MENTFKVAQEKWREGKLQEAESLYRELLAENPSHNQAWFQLSQICLAQGELARAEAACWVTLQLQEAQAELHCFLGDILYKRGKLDQAQSSYLRALELEPENHQSRVQLAKLHLFQGKDAWKDYSAYWEQKKFILSPLPSCPQWDGTSSLKGKHLLLLSDQGASELFLWIRYAKQLKAQGAKLTLVCQEPFIPLFSLQEEFDEVIPLNAPFPQADYFVPLGLLPALVGGGQEVEVPYLVVGTERVQEWSEKLDQSKGFCIGVAWESEEGEDLFPINSFVEVIQAPDIQLISLEKETAIESLLLLRKDDKDIVSQAALLSSLDLVITADTALAHLAGALGIPTWIILEQAPQWIWEQAGDKSSWYPTARLFRQQERRRWDSVFSQIADALIELQQSGVAQAEVSVGELVDKISILEIKSEKIKNEEQLANVNRELHHLKEVASQVINPSAQVDELKAGLKSVNLQLWDLEDDIRHCEQVQDFGPQFIEIARNIYRYNDRRYKLKKQLNKVLNSKLFEEKSH